jgi:hypothetical protein
MNSTSASMKQYEFIYSLAHEAHRTAPQNTLARTFARRWCYDFKGASQLGQSINAELPKLTSTQASKLITVLRDRSADMVMERIADEPELLKLFGADTNKFWNWMLSKDGIVGIQDDTEMMNVVLAHWNQD